ncbi:hypothetical protein CERSUDRAFT_162202 [Gelatoporia subvermispora B]|uniref:Letm1 RBD domain-containing protein n=1 Tax=Ceriporiopsis subvermispora (strain B) TaxID=914234 RepID=M2P9J5_CERS8|nr:hypothetical protein CERSUDRAFT_162202 [Gelatoporia subvermispora B]
MLASLGRNGFAESLLVSGHYRKTLFLQYNLQHRTLATCSAWHVSSRAPFRHGTARLLSSSTQPPDATSKSSKDDHPIPLSQVSRKQKIELRPAPVKPPKTASPAKDTTSQSAGSHSLPLSEDKPAPSTISPLSPKAVIDVTKQDLADASQHGILAPPPADASWAGRLFHQAKELFKFYFRGLKLIWTNRKRVQEMQARVKAGGQPLSRWEARFIQTYKLDALKLIPFAMIIIVIEEIIPLVVMYAPFLLPSTCILPSQKERIDTKKRAKQAAYAFNMKSVFENVRQRVLAQPDVPVEELLDSAALISINGILQLSTFGPPPIRLRLLKRHLKMIAEDDVLLKREDDGARLSLAELREALDERGIVTDDATSNLWRSQLQWWLSRVDVEAEQAGKVDPIRQRVILVASKAAGAA